MFSDDLPNPTWRKSTKCDMSGPNCVEVAKADGRIMVRNSQRPGIVTSFDRDEWRAFLDGAKAGEFDA
jgi:hypothetical protein